MYFLSLWILWIGHYSVSVAEGQTELEFRDWLFTKGREDALLSNDPFNWVSTAAALNPVVLFMTLGLRVVFFPDSSAAKIEAGPLRLEPVSPTDETAELPIS